ncbi:MAG: bifunctional riboflavin kinase/FAD synthetase [Acidobacteria bacterium]|nr:bifunctional riboflavin kinase/FAD synthetase [Acidobacteriota bacterium]
MQVFRSLDEARGRFGPCAVTIGNFDGTHIGHQELFREVALLANVHRWAPAVLTFDPHPARIVAPERAPKRLSTHEERVAVMSDCGIERVLILPFDAALAAVAPDAFVREILVGALGAKAVIVGDNFRFGHKHAGNIHLLADLGRELGFATHIEPAIRFRGVVVSSTEVRNAITSGRVGFAGRLLGRPYALAGSVVSGHGIGAKQTVPTLNLAAENEVLPMAGVYITRTRDLDGERRWNSITNIGMRPTFDGDALTIETFLLSPFDGATPARIAVEVLRRVRDERKFESPEALKAQIFRDVARANAYHRRVASL